MTKSPWFWLGLLLVVVLLVWLWLRHRKKILVVQRPGVGAPLTVRPAGPAPTSLFSTISGDAKGIFASASSIFSAFGGGGGDS